MKFTESMIRDWVETSLSAEELGDLLTMTGFELEEITVEEGEPVLDVNIMSNRGDGASVLGMAREVLAKDPGARPTELYDRAVARFPATDTAARDVYGLADVRIETPACTRFACRVFEGVTNGPSPAWVQDRLRKIGQRPVSLLVDLTNYVMFETGQPLHAYDLDKLGSQIVVREARAGEKLVTLDEKEHELQPGQMMICDADRPVGVAGVMGGLDTECGPGTTRCLLESANFNNQSVRKTRKQLGFFTEASFRFERHVDPQGVVAALNRFAELLEAAGGPRPVPGVIDVYPRPLANSPVRLRVDRVDMILGLKVEPEAVRGYLDRLGFEVTPVSDREFDVTAPTWRVDIAREDDLVEEVGRVHGYEKIPEAMPAGTTSVGGTHGADFFIDKLALSMVRCGFTEVVNHTLRDLHPLDKGGRRVLVRNPHSPEIAHLRDSLLPGLAESSARNGNADLMLFETGRVFNGDVESVALGMLAVGRPDRPHWQGDDSPVADFYTLKGVVEAAFRAIGSPVTLQKGEDPRLHPTRSAAVTVEGRQVGMVGQVHPDVAERAGLPTETVLGEFDLTFLHDLRPVDLPLKSLSRNPAVRRDISMLFAKSVPYADMARAIVDAGGPLLEKHWLFDVYAGKGIEPGQHSLSFALQLRKAGANLTDAEANQVRDSVVAALGQLGGRAR
ncbi:MAG: phenylalanine--tRNA ligase subunit beta [Fimbriimonadaceae bacterium]|nr:phenylalanine--tRNA ligase subunit beta [Fimbriimonadaceae bacterium]